MTIKPSVFLDKLKGYWGYFMTLVAIATFIWTLGLKSERKNQEGISIKNDVTEIKSTQIKEKQKTDSLLIKVNEIQKGQVKLFDNQNAMRNSYVRYLANDKALTKEDFIQYMNGLEFKIDTPESITTSKQEIKISVKKIE